MTKSPGRTPASSAGDPSYTCTRSFQSSESLLSKIVILDFLQIQASEMRNNILKKLMEVHKLIKKIVMFLVYICKRLTTITSFTTAVASIVASQQTLDIPSNTSQGRSARSITLNPNQGRGCTTLHELDQLLVCSHVHYNIHHNIKQARIFIFFLLLLLLAL